MGIMQPYKVELEEGLIKITTIDGYTHYYYQTPQGVLTLGFPYMIVWNDYVVRLFVPKPDGLPVVLDIQHNPL